MSTLGAQKVGTLSLHYPETGAWRADVVLTGGAVPAKDARLTLTAGDLAVLGTVLRSDNDAPDRPHAVMVGGIGWETAIAGAPPSYQNDAGVRRSTVLRDLASRAKSVALPGGEPIEMPSGADLVIGKAWSCPAAPPGSVLRVRDALSALFEQGFAPVWRVDPDGVTRFGLRVGTAVTARATQMRRNAGVGLTVYGIDSPRAFLPGGIVGGQTIRKVVIVETAGSLTAEVWTDARLSYRSRILRMVAEAFPALTFGYVRTYTVAGVGADGRLDLAPPTDAPHLPQLPKVEQWSAGGTIVTPRSGALVLVAFRDALPSRPVVVGFAPGMPLKLEINADEIRIGLAPGETAHPFAATGATAGPYPVLPAQTKVGGPGP